MLPPEYELFTFIHTHPEDIANIQQHLFTAITVLEQAVLDIPHTELEPEDIAQAALYLVKLYKNIGDLP
jgi:hypothetical protein